MRDVQEPPEIWFGQDLVRLGVREVYDLQRGIDGAGEKYCPEGN